MADIILHKPYETRTSNTHFYIIIEINLYIDIKLSLYLIH
jgi:hypothetical protein